MSQENVEIVKRGYEASNQTSALSPEVFAADFVLDLTEAAPDSESFGGSKPRSKLCAESRSDPNGATAGEGPRLARVRP
jgi:hypothetical protein